MHRALAATIAVVAATGIAAAGLTTSPAWADAALVERAPFATNPVTSQQASDELLALLAEPGEQAAPADAVASEEPVVEDAAPPPAQEAPPAPPPAQEAPPAPPPTEPAPAPAPPATAPPATAAPPTPSAPAMAAAQGPRDGACEASMLQLMQEARAAAGTAALVDDAAIDHVAHDWSTRLAASGELAHNPRYADHVFAARPEARSAGEVVGRGVDARPVFDEFMRSPTHRDAILRRAFTHGTVGCVRDDGGQAWVTANFWG